MPKNEKLKKTIEQFWDTIPPVWGKVRCNLRTNAVKDFNITLIQFHILRHIRRGISTVGELADCQQISRPAVSLVVEQLVKKGLVSRAGDTKDRRVICLTLTAEGQKLLSQLFGNARIWMAEKMDTLTIAELETLSNAMTILKDTFISTQESSR